MTHPTRQEAPAGHRPGVFFVDPRLVPKPPAGAVGIVIYDLDGQAMSGSWVVPDHDDALLLEAAWAYFDRRCDQVSVLRSRFVSPLLKLEP